MQLNEILLEHPLSLEIPIKEAFKDFRLGKYGLKPEKEVLVVNHYWDDLLETAVIYVNGGSTALIVPLTLNENEKLHSIESYYLIKDAPKTKDGAVDYLSVYEKVARKIDLPIRPPSIIIKYIGPKVLITMDNVTTEFKKGDDSWGWLMINHSGLSFSEFLMKELLPEAYPLMNPQQ